MKVDHDNESDDSDDDTPEFNAVVGGDAACEIVGDLAVKEDDSSAGGKNQEADEHPTERKLPIHDVIITKWGKNGNNGLIFGRR